MDFKDMQSDVVSIARIYEKKYSIKVDEEFILLKLMEEVGELAEAVLTLNGKSRPEKKISKKEAKKKLAHELADVVGIVMVCGDVYGVDLEKAIKEKWLKWKKV